ncbi:MAG: outer membrane protein assembly factor BamC [Aquincola sp.]|nr:outer membrane protein assembly factor BamC [Aquincola sp.]MDH4287592.1 outer membrane protein assembly factor BamC [Aquincola sp.]
MQAPLSLPLRRPRAACLVAAAVALAGCSTVENFLQGDKVDYRSQSVKSAPLEVPPDLTQLQRDGRYAAASGSVSASAYQSAAPAAAAAASTAVVAPAAVGEMRVVRDGNQRWLVVPVAPEQLWPQLREFWQERGFSLVLDNAQAGVMETDWAENRAKIPQDVIRRTLGKVLDSVYDTGERDRFRTRVERSGTASEVYISHRGMVEVITGDRTNENTMWTARPSDPNLEAEFLTRLMVKLGAKEPAARETVAKPVAAPARARAIAGQPALQVDEGFDRAWRRVGLALDRGGFTVEDRDRAGGLYFVRYVDPKFAATNADPGFFAKLFSFGKSAGPTGPVRYRIALKSEGERTNVTVQNSQGAPEASDVGQRIVSLLVDDLK